MVEKNDPKNDAAFHRFMRTVTEHVPPSAERETPYGRLERVDLAVTHLFETLRSDEGMIKSWMDTHGAPLIDAIIRYHKNHNIHPPHATLSGRPSMMEGRGKLPLGELEHWLIAKPNYRFRDLIAREDSLAEQFLHNAARLWYRRGDFSVNYSSEYDMRHRMAEMHLRQSLGKTWITNTNRMTHYDTPAQQKMIEAVMKLHHERGITPADDTEELRALFHEKLPPEIAKLRMPEGEKPEFVKLVENPDLERPKVRGT